MAVIPSLTQPRPPIIQRPDSRRRLVEPRPGASHIRRCSVSLCQRALDVRQRVGRAVRRRDGRVGKPVVGRQAAVEEDGGLEEVNDICVRGVGRAVAGDVEGREAGRVLGELVRPEVPIRLVLGDPVAAREGVSLERWVKGGGEDRDARVHVLQQIVLAKRREEAADVGAVVWRDECAWHGVYQHQFLSTTDEIG